MEKRTMMLFKNILPDFPAL